MVSRSCTEIEVLSAVVPGEPSAVSCTAPPSVPLAFVLILSRVRQTYYARLD